MALSEADFIGCEFAAKLASSKSMVRWIKPSEVVVSVQLPGRGAQSAAMRACKWPGETPEGERLQKRLAGFADLSLGSLHDFTLYLKRGGKKVATLNWAADTESKELAELRVMLAGVAHLPCAEAMQYGDEGRQLGQLKLHAKAIQCLTTGLTLLGDRYRGAGLRDDTGMYALLAEHCEKAGQVDAAWRQLDRVLKSRLAAYLALHGLPESA